MKKIVKDSIELPVIYERTLSNVMTYDTTAMISEEHANIEDMHFLQVKLYRGMHKVLERTDSKDQPRRLDKIGELKSTSVEMNQRNSISKSKTEEDVDSKLIEL